MPNVLGPSGAVEMLESDVDTVLEHADTVGSNRRDSSEAVLAVVEAAREENLIRGCVPAGCDIHVERGADGLDATIVIPDRAPVQSLHGTTMLTLRWNAGEDSVTLAGKVVPLSELAARLDAYDRAVNWSATQGLTA